MFFSLDHPLGERDLVYTTKRFNVSLPLCEGVEDTCGCTDDDDGDSVVDATNKSKKGTVKLQFPDMCMLC